MKNAIAYIRVSSKEQADNNTSLDSQEKECRAYARKHDMRLLDSNIFEERGESAKFINRPELQRLLAFVRKNRKEIDTLIIWKIDRLARNLGDYYGIKVALSKYDVKIVSITEPIDDDPVGRFLEAILAAAAQFDNEIRAMRSIGGMRARVEQGAWPHGVVIGYKKVNGRVVRDELYADKVIQVLLEFSTGNYTKAEIARFAYDLGIKTKTNKLKSDEGIKKIVTNLFYAGYTRNKLSPNINKGTHKALVDESVIYKNIDILTRRDRKVTYSGNEMFPLRSGTLLCTSCALPLTGSKPKGNGGEYLLYHCARPTCTKKVTGRKTVSADADKVHAEFRAILRAMKPLKPIESLFKTIVLRAWNDEYRNAVEQAKKLSNDIQDQHSLREKTEEKFIADKITAETRDRHIAKISLKIAGLEEDAQEADRYVKEREEIINNAMSFISEPDIFWNSAPLQIKRDIQLLLFPKGIVYDFETSFGTREDIKTYLLIQDLANNIDENSNLVGVAGLEPATNRL
jgi:site-specific DNA recombinase